MDGLKNCRQILTSSIPMVRRKRKRFVENMNVFGKKIKGAQGRVWTFPAPSLCGIGNRHADV